MCDTVRLFLYYLFRYSLWYCLFASSLILLASEEEIFYFEPSEEELAILDQQVKDQFNSYISKFQTYSLNTRSTESTSTPLQEQTYIDYQTAWNDFLTDVFYSGRTSYLFHIFQNTTGLGRLNGLRNTILQAQTNLITDVSSSLLDLIDVQESIKDKLDSLNIPAPLVTVNVNQQQVVDSIDQQTRDFNQQLTDILSDTQSIESKVSLLEDIKLYLANVDSQLNHLYSTATSQELTVTHIDNDLHDIKSSLDSNFEELIAEVVKNQDSSGLTESITSAFSSALEEQLTPTQISSSEMQEVYNQESSSDYVLTTFRGGLTELQSEVNSIQYTNINPVTYDYSEFNNYYSLDASALDPTDNDSFICEKVQEYIDQVAYTTENVKGQIISRLDEIKSSTLLTTEFDPNWKVVEANTFYKGFPSENWVVDFSKISLKTDILTKIYDFIYYILAIIIIYKQFQKVVD